MKKYSSPNSSSKKIKRSISAIFFGGLLASPSLHASDYTWLGANTTWGAPANWSAGTVPGSTDNAVFTGTFTNQPNLYASTATTGGVWMTGTLGQNVTISGSSTSFNLNIGGNTINGIPGLGILVDNTDTRTLTISASVQLQGAQTWMNSSGNLFTSSGLVQTNAKALTLSNTAAGGTTLSGVISGSGAITINNSGAGVTTFSNTGSTFTGQLTVAAGTLKIDTFNNTSSNGELGNAASGTPVILGTTGGSKGTIEYTGSGGTSSKALSMATGGGGTIQVDTAAAGLTLTGTISGSGSLTKTGAGTVFLQGGNTFSGGLNINNGTVSVSSSGPLGTGVVTVNSGGVIQSTNNNTGPTAGYVFNGGTYDGIANNSNYTAQGNVTVGTGGGTFISDTSGGNSFEQYTFGTLSIGTGTLTAKVQNSQGSSVGGTGNITFGAVTLTGNPTFNTAASTAGNFNVGSTAIQLNLGALGDGGTARTLTFSGVGTTTLNTAATGLVNGTAVNVTGGTLSLGSATSLGSLAAVSVSGGATLSLGAAETFGSLAGAGSVTNGGNTLTVGNTNNLSSSFSGVLGNGSGGLIKAGTGSLTLSGANTYTGVTTVSGGTLLVGANAPSGSAGALGNATSDVLVGATSGAVSASLLTNGAFTVGRNITVQSGNTGVATLGGNTAAASIFSGNVTSEPPAARPRASRSMRWRAARRRSPG